ncbi:MAG: hypothetical protein NUW37_00315 [Planctomycetes bacterium]|nr:hypothetical protein [Planctomycetota bacterium]
MSSNRFFVAGVSVFLLVIAMTVSNCKQKQTPDDGTPEADESNNGESNLVVDFDVPETGATAPTEAPGLHNLFRLDENVYAGSQPHGEEAFRALAAMGVKTIISVDGHPTDVDLAEKYSMTYVHVPVKYSAISHEEQIKICAAGEANEGPFFVHCFHGKHRGPAGAAVLLEGVYGWSADEARTVLERMGTSTGYPGLWSSVANFEQPDEDDVENAKETLQSRFEPQGIIGIMTPTTDSHDFLKDAQKIGFAVDPEHPDVLPSHEADMLANNADKLAENEDFWPENDRDDFRAFVAKYVEATHALRDALANFEEGGDTFEADDALDLVNRACSDCHKQFRNE